MSQSDSKILVHFQTFDPLTKIYSIHLENKVVVCYVCSVILLEWTRFVFFDMSLRLTFDRQKIYLSVVLSIEASKNFPIVVEDDIPENQFSKRRFEEYFHISALFD